MHSEAGIHDPDAYFLNVHPAHQKALLYATGVDTLRLSSSKESTEEQAKEARSLTASVQNNLACECSRKGK